MTATLDNDVLLAPCAPEAFAIRALLAREATRRARPAPCLRPRAVLREALAHPTGGEIIALGPARTARLLVSQGRIAWIHEDGDRESLLERLRAAGVDVTEEELASVVAECQQTGEHFAEVIARWRLAERDVVHEATRAIVDARLQNVLSGEESFAVFVPSDAFPPMPTRCSTISASRTTVGRAREVR